MKLRKPNILLVFMEDNCTPTDLSTHNLLEYFYNATKVLERKRIKTFHFSFYENYTLSINDCIEITEMHDENTYMQIIEEMYIDEEILYIVSEKTLFEFNYTKDSLDHLANVIDLTEYEYLA